MSSSEWKELYLSIDRERWKLRNKRNDYIKYVEVLQNLKSSMIIVNRYMKAAENNFKNGGYIDANKTLSQNYGQGGLNERAAVLSSSSENLVTVINNTKILIEDMTSELRILDIKYADARAGYESALAAEAAEAAKK